MSTQGGRSSSASCMAFGSGAGTEPISEQMREFISSEITRYILEQTPVIFDFVMEGILEILGEPLDVFRAKVMAIIGAHTLSFCEFRAELLRSIRSGTPLLVGGV